MPPASSKDDAADIVSAGHNAELKMNGQQVTGNSGAGPDVSAEEARLKEAMKHLKLLHIKVSLSTRHHARAPPLTWLA